VPERHRPAPRSHVRSLARAIRRDQNGQALVEFALVLPILLALVFGIVEFALSLSSQADETHIASEIARFATVNENPGESEGETLAHWGWSQLHNKALSGEGKSALCISFPNKGSEEPGQPVEVVFKRTVRWLPIPKLEVAETPLVGSAVMRLETHPTHYGKECYEQ
jgi:hypothetical protein